MQVCYSPGSAGSNCSRTPKYSTFSKKIEKKSKTKTFGTWADLAASSSLTKSSHSRLSSSNRDSDHQRLFLLCCWIDFDRGKDG
ncbi:unnamed protein product [Coffea canephora]|uniref:Uncharacterized protein n=1 Tax=Coffea canephora TaxID=49390 RepID=A0A068TXS6_COFCA|nr:unnamed protein product [Coffea canephora]